MVITILLSRVSDVVFAEVKSPLAIIALFHLKSAAT